MYKFKTSLLSVTTSRYSLVSSSSQPSKPKDFEPNTTLNMKLATVFLAVLGLAAAAPAAVIKKNALGDRIKADIEVSVVHKSNS